jgi:hypothetical protein
LGFLAAIELANGLLDLAASLNGVSRAWELLESGLSQP